MSIFANLAYLAKILILLISGIHRALTTSALRAIQTVLKLIEHQESSGRRFMALENKLGKALMQAITIKVTARIQQKI